jgi:sugar lactone lactonase YvrE
MKFIAAGWGALGVLVASTNVWSAPSALSYSGGTLTENFDSMGLAGTNTPAGWSVGWHNGHPPGTAGTVVRTDVVAVNSGIVAPSGAIAGFNCGISSGSAGLDRSLGLGTTGTSSPNGTNRFIEVQIQNNSGQTLRAIEVTYAARQWRTSSSASGQDYTNYLQFGVNGINFVFMGSAFDFHAPVTGPANIQVNGSLPSNSMTNLGGIFALPAPLPPGSHLWLRWLDVNDPATDPVMAMDDFSFRGLADVPEIVIGHDFGYTFTLFAGIPGVPAANNGTGTGAQFRGPHAIAADRDGNLYVADTSNHTVRKVTPRAEVTTLAGLAGVSGTNDGTGGGARFNLPEGICVDSQGNVFVSEIGNHTIRHISSNGVVTTIAGLAGSSGTNDGFGSAARFNVPVTVEVDGNGFLYVGDFANHTVRVISPSKQVSTLAGAAGISGTQDGPPNQARFTYPHTCRPDGVGKVYVADLGNHAIRKISAEGVVSTLAGLPGYSGTNDGTGAFARFVGPWGLVFEPSGNLLVSDRENNIIRRVTQDGTVKTIGGLAGVAGTNEGRGVLARFNRPRGLALDRQGNLFVVDTGNHTIRIGRPDPALQALRSSGRIVLSWPSWTTDYQVESSTNLPGSNWVPLLTTPTTVGERNFLTNSADGRAQFFRLRSE